MITLVALGDLVVQRIIWEWSMYYGHFGWILWVLVGVVSLTFGFRFLQKRNRLREDERETPNEIHPQGEIIPSCFPKETEIEEKALLEKVILEANKPPEEKIKEIPAEPASPISVPVTKDKLVKKKMPVVVTKKKKKVVSKKITSKKKQGVVAKVIAPPTVVAPLPITPASPISVPVQKDKLPLKKKKMERPTIGEVIQMPDSKTEQTPQVAVTS